MEIKFISDFLKRRKQKKFDTGCDGCVSAIRPETSELSPIEHKYNVETETLHYTVYKCDTCGRYWARYYEKLAKREAKVQWKVLGKRKGNIKTLGEFLAEINNAGKMSK